MIQKRYEGFLKTAVLWQHQSIFGMQQFEIINTAHSIDINVEENLRFGKYVERLVASQLKNQKNISIIAENIQIFNKKRTIGEMDCLLFLNNQPIHLEIIYKFYLYDTSVGTAEIDHFIGPNRKDSLKNKLEKLKDKQLPLLYNEVTEQYLKDLKLNRDEINQQVYFKAQLFVPYDNNINIELKLLNNACIEGVYVTKSQLNQFKDYKFYIPKKLDWLLTTHENVTWLIFDIFNTLINDFLQRQYAPLCWIKFKNGEIKKLFVVWW